jgi:hypothetical protein
MFGIGETIKNGFFEYLFSMKQPMNNISNSISEIFNSYNSKENEKIELEKYIKEIRMLKDENTGLLTRLTDARDTCRRLNRRCQKKEKEVNYFKKSLKNSNENIDSLITKNVTLYNRIDSIMDSLKKTSSKLMKAEHSSSNWMNLSKYLFHKTFSGVIVTYDDEKGKTFYYVKDKISGSFIANSVKKLTAVECFMQSFDSKYVLVKFLNGDNVGKTGWVYSRNVQLYPRAKNIFDIIKSDNDNSKQLNNKDLDKKKVIFLNVDGVLNNFTLNKSNSNECISVRSMIFLNKIIKKTNAGVVITYPWSEGKTIQELQRTLNKFGFRGTVVGKIKKHPKGTYTAIKEWYKNNKDISGYVILDSNIIDISSGFQVKTDFYGNGLTEERADKAIEILNR